MTDAIDTSSERVQNSAESEHITVPRELLARALQAISASIFGTDTYKVSSRGDFASKVEKEIHTALDTAPPDTEALRKELERVKGERDAMARRMDGKTLMCDRCGRWEQYCNCPPQTLAAAIAAQGEGA